MALLDTNQSMSCEETGGTARELAGLLNERGLTISVAESCSGGLLAKMLTDIPGSSAYFLAGVVAYSNGAKSTFLGVPSQLIELNGAVSAEVAEAMAEGMLRTAGSDIALSVTGIAGPEGGTEEKPVGSVYIGLADSNGCSTMHLSLSGSREQIRIATACGAFNWAMRHLRDRAPSSPKVQIS